MPWPRITQSLNQTGGFIAFVSLLATVSGETQAREVQLFERQQPRADYSEQVKTLRPGDQVRFSDGKTYTLGPDLKIGPGAMTRVFALENPPGAVLRIPESSNPLALKMIEKFAKGHAPLKNLKVPAVDVLEGHGREYLVVERLVADWVSAPRFFEDAGLPFETRQEASEALVRFARSTAAFRAIGDFNINQIAYDPHRKTWILFDWTQGHEPAFEEQGNSKPMELRGNAFDRFFFEDYLDRDSDRGRWISRGPETEWIRKLSEQVDAAIQLERKRLKDSPSLLTETLRAFGPQFDARNPALDDCPRLFLDFGMPGEGAFR